MALSELIASVVSGIENVSPPPAIGLAIFAVVFAGVPAVIACAPPVAFACAGAPAFAPWPITRRERTAIDTAGKNKITRSIFMDPTPAFAVGWNDTPAGRAPSCLCLGQPVLGQPVIGTACD